MLRRLLVGLGSPAPRSTASCIATNRAFATVEDCQPEVRQPLHAVVGPESHPARALQIDTINQLFVSARDEIEYAKEDAETVYFNDSCKEASAAVDQVLKEWRGVLSKLDETEKMRLQRAMGLKMEQLKVWGLTFTRLHK